MEEKYTFEFNVVELNVILSGLTKLSYESSAKIIHKIQEEYQAQQTELEKAKKEKVTPKK